MELTILLGLFALLGRSYQYENRKLNEFVKHFEGLSYATEPLHSSHIRAKRSTSDPYVKLSFKAHGRDFNLRLRRDTSTFSSDFKIQKADGSLDDGDISFIYEGEVWDEPHTEVYGSIIDGVFAGTIHTPKTTYYIEKSEVHFPQEKKPFHSVIYSEDDIDYDPRRLKRSAETQTCGNSNSEIYRWMNTVQNSAVTKDEPAIKKRDIPEGEAIDRPSGENIYSKDYTVNSRKQKREVSDNKRTCTLFLQSDIELWKYMTGTGKDQLGYSPDRAREEILSLFASHVKGIKNIYGNTMFEYDDVKYSGFSFVVRRVKVNDTSDCPDNSDDANSGNPLCAPNIDVSNFLNLNSLSNHDDFCLAYIFTYRDFTGGTLGLAWVGSPTRASGGICERWKEYTENSRKVYKSLNTGICTLINYGQRVLPKVSTLTFAHEVGHNFGSPHDSGDVCTPFSGTTLNKQGNYIMFASATSGDRPNNSKFSPCSLGNITQVLHAVLQEQYGKHNCFVESEEAFCGNKIVEGDEQCDCGYVGDCNDACCNPRGGADQCKLKSTASCSPTAGPCCKSDCTKIPAADEFTCRIADECNDEVVCDGLSAACPSATPKANLTDCNEMTQVCVSGECRWSICYKFGWDKCYVTTPEENAKEFDKGKLCFVACQNPTSSECVSSGDAEALAKAENKAFKDFLDSSEKASGIKLPPGAPCDNFQGYCDVFQKCRGVDADGPLARLKNLLFSQETFNEIRDWIIRYWWAVLLMGIGVVVLMGLFISVCAVHTPSSNPKRAPARKLTLKKQPKRSAAPPGQRAPGQGGPPPGRTPQQGYSVQPHRNQPPPYSQGAYEMKGVSSGRV